jgi:radical SAM superfamily enzyme YgiQ (UPF0313 family)
MLWVVDDNFLVDLDRARAIAAGLVQAGAVFQWSIQATTNLVARLSLEDLKLLRRSGLHQICQGAESGSLKMLKAMNKDFQNFDSIYESAGRCLAAGIRPSFNIIFAFPGEGKVERQETVRFVMDVCRRFPGAEFWTNIFTPYPGAPIIEKAAEIGIQLPTSFEGWADFFPRYTKLPWLDGREHQRLQVMRDFLRIAFDRVPIAADRRGRVTRMVQKCISIPARWRLEHDALAFPVELWLNNKLKQRTAALKPAVDAKRLEPAAQAAQVACP